VLLELTVAEQRFNAVMEILRDGLTVTEVAERYGVSRQAVHSWLRRYASGGLEALADRSHRPIAVRIRCRPRSRPARPSDEASSLTAWLSSAALAFPGCGSGTSTSLPPGERPAPRPP
jgi:transposase-like protein